MKHSWRAHLGNFCKMVSIPRFTSFLSPQSIFLILTLCPASLIMAQTTKQPYRTYTPDGFPIPVILRPFQTWADDNKWNDTWTAFPETSEQVVAAANWALQRNIWELRPSGEMHSWSPLTFPNAQPISYERKVNVTDGRRWPIVVLKTKYLTSTGIISNQPGNFTFWAQPGISLEALLKNLEANGMGLGHHPAPGVLTLGGILAIGGHGACTNAVNETLTPGHTFGSVSNLIVSVTAVVYDKEQDKFVLKEFHRSHPDTKAFLVNLGRTFVTNVTMMAAPLQYIRCRSYTNFTDRELFAHPDEVSERTNTFSKFLDQTGRVEAIFFPFVNKPWFKTWTVIKNPKRFKRLPRGMIYPRKVTSPYNYPFCDSMNPAVASQVQLLKSTQNDLLAVSIGKAIYATVVGGLTMTRSWDIWGASKNVMLYLKPTTLRYHANGYAIITSRADTQLILHESYQIYKKLIKKFRREGKYPVNGALEIRASGLDRASDVGIAGAESPAIAATAPVEGRPEFDTVIWFDVLTYTRTAYTCHFMKELEDKFIQTFDGVKATFRVEWSKGWSYTENQPWTNEDFLRTRIPNSVGQSNWKFFKNVTSFYGHRVFTNDFLNWKLHLGDF